MIFSSLFKPKWKHKDVSIRLQALESLNSQNSEDLNVLQSMAKEDGDHRVRLGALGKLNQFSMWLDASNNDHDAKVVKRAKTLLEQEVLNPDSSLCQQEQRRQYIRENHQSAFLEKVCNSQLPEKIRIEAAKQLNKPPVTFKLLLSINEPTEIDELLLQFTDESDLSRLNKKATHPHLRQRLQDILEELEQKKQLPIAVNKKGRLILSKLLALKESFEYSKIEAKFKELKDQWHTLMVEADKMEDEDKQPLLDKFADVEQAVISHMAKLRGEWEQEVQEQILIDTRNQLFAEVKAGVESSKELLSKVVWGQVGASEIDGLVANIQDWYKRLEADDGSSQGKEALFNQINSLTQQTQSIPQQMAHVSALRVLVEKISVQPLPCDVNQIEDNQTWFNQWKDSWKSERKQLAFGLDVELEERQSAYFKEWQKALKELRGESIRQSKKVAAKLNTVERLISQGRYNVAQAAFAQAEEWFAQLRPEDQSRQQRKYDSVAEQISNLNDWKEYIATPRKKSLLEDIQALATTPLENPEDQAHMVRTHRKTWNSLGTVDTSEDKALNEAFNEACEQAFSTCREFYAEQEALRKQNLEKKTQLIAAIVAVADEMGKEGSDLKLISSQFNSLQSQWRKIGDVDKKDVKRVAKSYREACKPIQKGIADYQEDNARLKQNIVKKAQQLLESDDFSSSIEMAKSLQNDWQNVGFAGNQKDNELWTQFRAVNNQLFGKRDALNAERKEEQQQVFEQLLAKVDEVESQVESASDSSELNRLMHVLEELNGQDPDLGVGLSKTFNSRVSKVKQALTKAIEVQSARDIEIRCQALFDVLTQAKSWQDVDNDALPAKWLAALQNSGDGEFASLLLQLEVISEIDSPEEEQELRQQIQMQMLTEKMSNRELVSFNVTLEQLLSAAEPGALNESQAMRVKAAVEKNLMTG